MSRHEISRLKQFVVVPLAVGSLALSSCAEVSQTEHNTLPGLIEFAQDRAGYSEYMDSEVRQQELEHYASVAAGRLIEAADSGLLGRFVVEEDEQSVIDTDGGKWVLLVIPFEDDVERSFNRISLERYQRADGTFDNEKGTQYLQVSNASGTSQVILWTYGSVAYRMSNDISPLSNYWNASYRHHDDAEDSFLVSARSGDYQQSMAEAADVICLSILSGYMRELGLGIDNLVAQSS